jgi:diguanylate cyclase (GGDEF)-like protein
MPNASLGAAHERVEEWRISFASMIIDYEGEKLSATFSAGIANYPDQGITGEAVLRAADKALYLSKSTGRNRVTIYNPSLATQEHPHAN